jgi:hypothetical protein
MLSRRRFQPSLDSLSDRIAPTAAGGLMGAAIVMAHSANVGPAGAMTPMDSDSPDSGGSGPVIGGNPTPPPHINC